MGQNIWWARASDAEEFRQEEREEKDSQQWYKAQNTKHKTQTQFHKWELHPYKIAYLYDIHSSINWNIDNPDLVCW